MKQSLSAFIRGHTAAARLLAVFLFSVLTMAGLFGTELLQGTGNPSWTSESVTETGIQVSQANSLADSSADGQQQLLSRGSTAAAILPTSLETTDRALAAITTLAQTDRQTANPIIKPQETRQTSKSTTVPTTTATTAATTTATSTAATTTATTAATTTAATAATTTATTAATSADHAAIDPTRLAGYVVVLDPGHQTHANYNLEPISPDPESTIMKAKTSSGTTGIVTGIPEYRVNLDIGLMLRDYLESQGCTVYMTRTENDVDLSNIDRALFALSKEPDVYLRLHCNGSTNQSVAGAGIYIANTGLYASRLPEWGSWLAASLCQATNAANKGVHAGSTYTGLNWATDIPSFLVEMGYMSNPAEDRLLSDPVYQMKLCQGFADFISQMPQR